MGIVKGGFLRLLQTALYFLIFCCAAIILGFYSYFLAVQADRDTTIPTWQKAVEGISGAAVLYLIFATVMTCCLGGITVFALLAIILDVLFVGGMIAIAVLTRDGASSCSGYVHTPLGNGQASSSSSGYGGNFGSGNNENLTYEVSNRLACKYNTACFAVSIIAAFLFLITAAMQVALVRHHKKEKRYGPSPKNNYTEGYGKRKFWQRKPKNAATTNGTRDAELGAGGLAAPAAAHDMRPSYETGTTVGNNHHSALAHEKVEQPLSGSHAGYHTQPQGTGVNPYGYTTNTTTTTGTATNY